MRNLLSRLDAFTFDQGEPVLPFSARLARENSWTPVYAERVLDEYRRFLYLAVSAAHPVTPSEQVDQAWHLHLTYTRSYWEDLCTGVLASPLHHEPTRGGADAGKRYLDQYAATLAAYERAFGGAPPADIWPSPERRFGDDLQWRRVNTTRSLVVPKRGLALALAAIALVMVVLISS